jgi:hypothetical protein
MTYKKYRTTWEAINKSYPESTAMWDVQDGDKWTQGLPFSLWLYMSNNRYHVVISVNNLVISTMSEFAVWRNLTKYWSMGRAENQSFVALFYSSDNLVGSLVIPQKMENSL